MAGVYFAPLERTHLIFFFQRLSRASGLEPAVPDNLLPQQVFRDASFPAHIVPAAISETQRESE